jgi:5-formyltetrahydrofolate cyclo-ligase
MTSKEQKILLVSDFAYPIKAGTERLVFGVADWFTNQYGIQTDILAPAWSEAAGKRTVNGVNIHLFETHDIKRSNPVGRIADFIKAGLALEKYDIYHGFYTMPPLLSTIALAKLKHAKSLVTFFGREQLEANLANPLKRFIALNALKQADGIGTYTWNLEKHFKETHFKERKLTTLQGWAEEKFKSGQPTAGRKKKIVLFVGRIDASKGVFVLMKAFAKIKDKVEAKLVLVGPPHQEKEARQLIEEEGLKDCVDLRGFVSDQELNQYYNDCHVVAVPALHGDAFGLSLMEAVVCGKPVICTDSVGSPTGEKDDELIVSRGDVDGLADLLLKLLSNEKFYQQAKNVSLKRAKLFNKEAVMKKYLQVYADAKLKPAVRLKALQKRESLSEKEVKEKSESISKRLAQNESFQACSRVCFYHPKGKEVDTTRLIDQALEQGKQVFLPITQGEKIGISRLENIEALVEGAHGIKEPREREFVPPESIDLFIVPGVAFGLDGARTGRGKGCYDRLLCRTKAEKIGLAFEEQIVSGLESEAHDVPMDTVITEKRALKRK